MLIPQIPLDIMVAMFTFDFPMYLIHIRIQILAYLCLSLSSSNHAGSIVRPKEYTDGLDEDPHCLTWDHVLFRIDKNPSGGHNLLTCKVDTHYGKTLASVDKSYILLPNHMPAANGPLLLLILAIKDGAVKSFTNVEQVLDPAMFKDRSQVELFLSINESRCMHCRDRPITICFPLLIPSLAPFVVLSSFTLNFILSFAFLFRPHLTLSGSHPTPVVSTFPLFCPCPAP